MVPLRIASVFVLLLMAGCAANSPSDDGSAAKADESRPTKAPSAPSLSMRRDEMGDRITIESASGVAYSDRAISNDGAASGIKFRLNGDIRTASEGTSNPMGTQTAMGTGPVQAGDFIELCAKGSAANNVVVKMFHTSGEAQLFQGTFATLVRCP